MVNVRHLLKWSTEQDIENILEFSENMNLCQDRGFVYLVPFIKLKFRLSNINCIGPFISSDSENE